MTTLAQRIIETQQALTEAEAQANKPAQLAEQLAQLQAAQAAEQEKHQQVLAHYLEIIAPRNGQTVETLRTRRAALAAIWINKSLKRTGVAARSDLGS